MTCLDDVLEYYKNGAVNPIYARLGITFAPAPKTRITVTEEQMGEQPHTRIRSRASARRFAVKV